MGEEARILVSPTLAHRVMQERRSLVAPRSQSPPQLSLMSLLGPVETLLHLLTLCFYAFYTDSSLEYPQLTILFGLVSVRLC